MNRYPIAATIVATLGRTLLGSPTYASPGADSVVSAGASAPNEVVEPAGGGGAPWCSPSDIFQAAAVKYSRADLVINPKGALPA